MWNCKDGSELLKLHWSDLDATQQRPVQWTFDEAYLAHITTNEVKFFPAAAPQLSQPSHRLHVKSVAQFALAPAAKPYQIAAFLPSKGTDPARVNIYTFPLFGAAAAAAASSSSADAAPAAASVPQPTASKSFFKAEEVTLKWSPTGAAILIETRTSTDKTGKSYYGESGLHLLHADGSYQGTVPFGTNPGPVQDVAWSPTGREFMVIQGFQPAKSTLFVATNCTPIREYGTGSRNTIRWSPHGRFVVLGGFGNLAGEMEFWDQSVHHIILFTHAHCHAQTGSVDFHRNSPMVIILRFCKNQSFIQFSPCYAAQTRADPRCLFFFCAAVVCFCSASSFKFKLMGKAIDRDGAKSFEFTPDGRNFITASLRPWRRVDNGYKVWTYAGEPVYAEKYDELYQVLAQPAPQGMYPNRPQSPRLSDKRKLAAAAPPEPVKTAYIPPHLRAQGATAPSAIMKRETDSAPRKLNSQERAAITGEATSASSGAGADSAESLNKNQLKRQKAKLAAAKRFEEEKAAEEAAEAERLAELAKKQGEARRASGLFVHSFSFVSRLFAHASRCCLCVFVRFV